MEIAGSLSSIGLYNKILKFSPILCITYRFTSQIIQNSHIAVFYCIKLLIKYHYPKLFIVECMKNINYINPNFNRL